MLEWDISLFYFINQEAVSPFLDQVLPTLRDGGFWVPFYIVLSVIALIRYKLKALVWLVFSFLVVGVSDGVSNYALKKQVERVRPCHSDSPVDARLLVTCGSGYSMNSAHAANHMSMAIFFSLSLFYGHWLAVLLLVLWAVSIGYAQIYVGVHFPSDVFVGFTLGLVVGLLGMVAWKKWCEKIWPASIKP
jgi:undecaprenyl-diphosphatase